jgi:hypothetical protein
MGLGGAGSNAEVTKQTILASLESIKSGLEIRLPQFRHIGCVEVCERGRQSLITRDTCLLLFSSLFLLSYLYYLENRLAFVGLFLKKYRKVHIFFIHFFESPLSCPSSQKISGKSHG